MSRQADIDRGAEVMLDFVCGLSDSKEDDELVFIETAFQALADACGIEFDEEIEPMTAGELRRRTRAAKGALAHGEGP